MGLFSKSDKLDKLEKRLDELEKENVLLRNTMSEIADNLKDADTAMKILMAAHQQIAIDVTTIYDALQQIINTAQRGAVDPLEEYLVKINPFGSDDDDGGLLN